MNVFDYFWMEGTDLPAGIGFGLFTPEHFCAVAVCMTGVILFLRAFLKRTPPRQNLWLRILAVLLLLGNIARDVFLLIKGRMSAAYLPFHLCSFAIFVYLLYAFMPEKYSDSAAGETSAVALDTGRQSDSGEKSGTRILRSPVDKKNEFEAIVRQSRFREALGEIGCVLLLPGTLIALILPDWSAYPLLNYMCIHSFLWHAVLTAFPLALLMSGRVHPTIRHIWYPVVYLAVLVPPALWFDRRFDVNFLFVNWPLPDTPLMAVYHIWGKYWLAGYALLAFSVILAEYILIEIIRKAKRRVTV